MVNKIFTIMNNQIKNTTIELLKRELEFRNYSFRTVNTYCSLISHMAKMSHLPLESITLSQFNPHYAIGFVMKGNPGSSPGHGKCAYMHSLPLAVSSRNLSGIGL